MLEQPSASRVPVALPAEAGDLILEHGPAVGLDLAKVAQSEAEARQEVAKAQGDARATVVRANADATALAKKGAAIRKNPEVLQLEAIDKLNPQVTVVYCTGTGSGNCPSVVPAAAATRSGRTASAFTTTP